MNKTLQPRRRRSEKRKRSCGVFVRLTPDEFAHAKEQAGLAGMGTARMIRALLTETQIKPGRRLPEEVYRAVVSFGTNLNQIARAMSASPFDCADHLAELKHEAGAILTWVQQS